MYEVVQGTREKAGQRGPCQEFHSKTMGKELLSLIFCDNLLLLYRNATDCLILILYLAALPNSLMSSSSLFGGILRIFLYIVSCHLQTVPVFFFSI